MAKMPRVKDLSVQNATRSIFTRPLIAASALQNGKNKKSQKVRQSNLSALVKGIQHLDNLASRLGSFRYIGPAIDSLRYAILRESFELSVDAFSGCIYYPDLDGWIQPIPLPSGYSSPTLGYALRNDSIISSSGEVTAQIDGTDLIPEAHATEVNSLKPGDTAKGKMWFFGASPGIHTLKVQYSIPGEEVSRVIPPGIPVKVRLPLIVATSEQPYIAGDKKTVAEGITQALGISVQRDENGIVTSAQAIDRWGIKRIFSVSKVDFNNGVAVTLTYSEFKSDGTPNDIANSKGEVLKIVETSTAEVFEIQTAQATEGYDWVIHRETDIYGIDNYMHTSITFKHDLLDMRSDVSPQSNPSKKTSFTGKFSWQPFGDPQLVASTGTPLQLVNSFGKELSRVSFFGPAIDEEKTVEDYVSKPLPQYESNVPLEMQYAFKLEVAILSMYACTQYGGILAGPLGFAVCVGGLVAVLGSNYVIEKWMKTPPIPIPRMIPSPSSTPTPTVPQPNPNNQQGITKPPNPQPPISPPVPTCAPDEVLVFGQCVPLSALPDWTPDL
jgi:hypothetical protein